MTLTELPVLILNPFGRCNCRCTMCDIWKAPSEQLTPAELERQIESLDRLSVRWVVFSGGEALMHPDFWTLTAMLRGRGIRITLLSSGLLLSRNAGRIAGEIDDLIVSLDGPQRVHDEIRGVDGAFSWLERGVRGLHRLRPDFPVSARCTVQRRNLGALCETAAAARVLGLRSISFLAADLTSEAFHRPQGWPLARQLDVGPAERASLARLDQEIDALIARGECGAFIAETPEKLRRIARHFRVCLGLEVPSAPQCNAPWTSAVVEANGDVRPCFFHRPVGNLKHGTLQAILNSPQALAFRGALDVATNTVCQRCVCSLNWKGQATSA